MDFFVFLHILDVFSVLFHKESQVCLCFFGFSQLEGTLHGKLMPDDFVHNFIFIFLKSLVQ